MERCYINRKCASSLSGMFIVRTMLFYKYLHLSRYFPPIPSIWHDFLRVYIHMISLWSRSHADRLRCSVLQRVTCVAVCCSVLQCVADDFLRVYIHMNSIWSRSHADRLCCSVLQCVTCVAVCCSVLQCVSVCCRWFSACIHTFDQPLITQSCRQTALQCVAVCDMCCGVLQCVADDFLRVYMHEISLW